MLMLAFLSRSGEKTGRFLFKFKRRSGEKTGRLFLCGGGRLHLAGNPGGQITGAVEDAPLSQFDAGKIGLPVKRALRDFAERGGGFFV